MQDRGRGRALLTGDEWTRINGCQEAGVSHVLASGGSTHIAIDEAAHGQEIN